MAEILLDALLDALIDCGKMLPFLFLACLFMELLEHRASKNTAKMLAKTGKLGPILGAFLGAVPQCGFSVAAANLYSGRIIGIGILAAVFVSTSDEAVIVMLSQPKSIGKVLLVLAVKIVLAIICGYLFEFLYKKTALKKLAAPSVSDVHGHEHEHCSSCRHSNGKIWKSATLHTLNMLIFVFIANVLLNIAIMSIGEQNLSKILLQDTLLQPILAAAVGFIPNCAASVILAELYLEGALSFGAVIAGLTTSAGVGMLVLFRTNKNIKENLSFAAILFIFAIISGILLQLFIR